MVYVLLIVVLLVVIYGCYVYTKTGDILNPISAFSLPILVSVIVNLCFYDGKGYEISSRTYLIYLVGVVAFTGGCCVTYQSALVKRPCEPVELKYNSFMLKLYGLIASIGTVVSIFYIFEAAICGAFGTNIVRNIRWYSLYEKGNGLIGKYSIIFVEVSFCTYAYKYFILSQKDRKIKNFVLVFALEYIVAIMTTMARTVILQFVIETTYLFIKGTQGKNRTGNRGFQIKVILLCSVGLCVMQVLAKMTEKAVYVDEKTGETLNWLIPYLGKEFYIFEQYISQHAGVTNGINSFGFWGRFLYKMGLLKPKYVVNIPGGQVASFISGPYTDFGAIGVFVVMLINGMAIGYVYKRGLKSSGWWLIFYAGCLYSCLIAFFSFQFSMSSQLYFAIIVIIMCIDTRGRLHVKKLNVKVLQ